MHLIKSNQDEIVPVDGNITENGIKGDTTMEKVSKLKPAFVKPHGMLRLSVPLCD
jgi:acetyl-CoA acetyltransferase